MTLQYNLTAEQNFLAEPKLLISHLGRKDNLNTVYFEIRERMIHKIELACSILNLYLTSWFQAASVENLNCSFVSVYLHQHLHSLRCCCY
jgi:hypothetical protein